MKYDLVIFDLDGTILDTLNDLANAVNYALAAHGHPVRTLEEIRQFVGNGVANLISRSVPEGTDEAERASVLADFKARYREHMNDATRPYPGIPELLAALRSAGVKVGVNSNKFDAALQNLCRIHFDGLYDLAAGECETTPKKPDPTAAQRIMAELRVSLNRSIYIGDSAVDLETAKNAGMDSAWVSWGFRRREEMQGCEAVNTFDSVEELKAFLLG